MAETNVVTPIRPDVDPPATKPRRARKPAARKPARRVDPTNAARQQRHRQKPGGGPCGRPAGQE